MPGTGDSDDGCSISGYSILGTARGGTRNLFGDFRNSPVLMVPDYLDASIGKLQFRPTCRSRNQRTLANVRRRFCLELRVSSPTLQASAMDIISNAKASRTGTVPRSSR